MAPPPRDKDRDCITSKRSAQTKPSLTLCASNQPLLEHSSHKQQSVPTSQHWDSLIVLSVSMIPWEFHFLGDLVVVEELESPLLGTGFQVPSTSRYHYRHWAIYPQNPGQHHPFPARSQAVTRMIIFLWPHSVAHHYTSGISPIAPSFRPSSLVRSFVGTTMTTHALHPPSPVPVLGSMGGMEGWEPQAI